MPIAYAEPDEMQDEEQDLEPGVPIQPQPPVASANIPAPAVPPVQPPPTAGAIPRSMRPPVNQAPGGFNMELWREQNAQLPMAKAEEAVGSALRFQAVRQYQADIAAGKSPAEALARSAPLMFYGPKNTLSGAAQFMRATGPQRPIDIGGIGYRVGPDGGLVPITPPKPSGYDLAEYHSILAQISQTQKELDDMPLGGADSDQKRAKLRFLREQLQAIRQRGATPPRALPGAPAPPAAPTAGTAVSPPTVAPAAPAGPIQTVTSQEQFDRLPSGTVYIGRNGRRYRKP